MFFETTYNQDGLGKTVSEADVKAAVAACMPQWKAAGRPQDVNFCSTVGTGGIKALPNQPITTLPAPTLPGATGGVLQAPATPGAAATADDSGFSIGSIFENIPPTLLYVGGAIMVFMLLKKR